MANSFNNQKVQLYFQDGAEFLEKRENQYDIIIVDSSDPIGPGITLFTEQFYRSLFRALRKDGIAVTQLESIFWHAGFIHSTFNFIKKIFPISCYYYTMVPTYPSGMIGFSFCSRKYHPIGHFIPERANLVPDLKYYHADIHRAAFILPAFAKKMF